MHYMLVFFENDDVFAAREKDSSDMGAWLSYIGSLHASGIMVSGNGLEPPKTAATVRVKNGERLVQDGPVATTKEQLGGYVIIDVPDMDTALNWAAKAPSSMNGATEVRACMPPPRM